MPPIALTTQPHNIEAERTVIGALLLEPEAIYNLLGRLRPDDFYDPIYRDIYAAIQQLSEKGTAVDFVTAADHLKNNEKIQRIGGSAFLAKLTAEVPTSSHINHYTDIILEKSRRRELGTLGKKIVQLAHEDTKSSDELTELAERAFLDLARQRTRDEPVRIGDMRAERFDHYTQLHEAEDPTAYYGIRTGFTPLDDKLTGLAPGQLIVLAGRPGMGKTALALDIASAVAFQQRKVVALFSLEMSKEEVFGRLLGKSLGVESWKIDKGALDDAAFDRMGPVFDAFADQPLFIDDDANTTLVNIRSKARRHKMQHGLDLLIIDYLQLIEVTDRLAGENQTQRITYISKSLKQLARDLDCPVLALSQLSRACETRPDKRPQLSDLRDSGSIEQDADRVLMLYRESEYNEDCENPDLTDLFIRKNRHGPKGQIELRFERAKMSFVAVSRSLASANRQVVPAPE